MAWTDGVTCVAFHPVHPVLLCGFSEPSCCLREVFFSPSNQDDFTVGVPLTLTSAVTHVMYDEQAAAAPSARCNRRVAVVILEDKTIVVADLVRRAVLFRHEPRSVRLLTKVGRIALARVYSPFLYFVAEVTATEAAAIEAVELATAGAASTTAAPSPSSLGNSAPSGGGIGSSAIDTGSSGRTSGDMATFSHVPTVRSLFIVRLNQSNLSSMGKLDSSTAVEHLCTHPLAPIIAVGHEVEKNTNLIRVYTHLGSRPQPYNVVGMSANGACGKQVLSIAFLPTRTTATVVEQGGGKKGRKSGGDPLVVVRNVLLAVAKARRVCVYDVSIPGTPIEMYYITNAPDRLFAGCFAAPRDPTVLWIADTEGRCVPHAMNTAVAASAKLMEPLTTTSTFGVITFPVAALSAPLQQANAARRELPFTRDGHHVALTIPGAAANRGRSAPPLHSHVDWSFHPTLPFVLLASADEFVVKRLVPTSRPGWLEASPTRTSPIVIAGIDVPSPAFAPRGDAAPFVLPSSTLMCDTETIDPCAIRLSFVELLSGALDAPPNASNADLPPLGTASMSSWPAPEDVHGASKRRRVRPQNIMTVGAILESTPVALVDCWLLSLTPTVHAAITCYLRTSARSNVGGAQWSEKVVTITLLDVAAAASGNVSSVPPLTLTRTFSCASACVDTVSSTLYFIDTDQLDAVTPVVNVVPFLDAGGVDVPSATAEYLGKLTPITLPISAALEACAALPTTFIDGPISVFSAQTLSAHVYVLSASKKCRRPPALILVDLEAMKPLRVYQGVVDVDEGETIASIATSVPGDGRVASLAAAATTLGRIWLLPRDDGPPIPACGVEPHHDGKWSAANEILRLAWAGPLLAVHRRSGHVTTVDPAQVALSLANGRRPPSAISTSPLLSLPSEMHVVGILPDRIVAVDTSAIALLKQHRHASITKAVARVRDLQVRAQTNLADPAKAKSPQAAADIAREQQALLEATMTLQRLTSDDDKRRARILAGGAAVRHVAVPSLAVKLACHAAFRHLCSSVAGAVPLVQQLLLPSAPEGGLLAFYLARCSPSSCTDAVMQLLLAIGWDRTALAIAGRALEAHANSSSLVLGAAAVAEGSSSAAKLESNAGAHWPPTLLDVARLAVDAATTDSAERKASPLTHLRTESASGDAVTNSVLTPQNSFLADTDAEGGSTNAAAAHALHHQPRNKALLGIKLEELSWFADRDRAFAPAVVVGDILATFPSAVVPPSLVDLVKRSDVPIAELLHCRHAADCRPDRLSGYASKFGGGTAASHAVDPRPLTQAISYRRETSVAAAQQAPPLPAELGGEPAQCPVPPTTADTTPSRWDAVVAPDGAVLSVRWPPPSTGFATHSSSLRQPMAASSLLLGGAASDTGDLLDSAPLRFAHGGGGGRSAAGGAPSDDMSLSRGDAGGGGAAAEVASSLSGSGGRHQQGDDEQQQRNAADVAAEQERLRTAYLNSFKGVSDGTAVWSSDSDDEDGGRGGGGGFGGGIRLGGVKFKVNATAATPSDSSSGATPAATLAAPPFAAASRRISGAVPASGGSEGRVPDSTFPTELNSTAAAPAPATTTTTAGRRRIVTDVVGGAVSVADHLRRAFNAFNAKHFDDADDALGAALPLLAADPAEVASATRIVQLVHYRLCCRLLVAAGSTADAPAPRFSEETALRLMHVLQLRLAPDHMGMLCETVLVPMLAAGGCIKAAFTALTLHKFMNPHIAGTAELERLETLVNDAASFAAADAIDEALCNAASAWSLCYVSLRQLSEADHANRRLCGYCGAVIAPGALGVHPGAQCPCCQVGTLE